MSFKASFWELLGSAVSGKGESDLITSLLQVWLDAVQPWNSFAALTGGNPCKTAQR